MLGRVMESPIGKLGIWGEDGVVWQVVFHETRVGVSNADFLVQAEKELQEYFTGKRRRFTFPYCLKAEGFQRCCLEELQRVSFGTTVSYGELAAMAGVPGGARAVGNAMHKNPLPIVIPCHRVIKADGSLGGFGGGTKIKRYLLEMEGGWPKT